MAPSSTALLAAALALVGIAVNVASAATAAAAGPANLTDILTKGGQYGTFMRLLRATQVGQQIESQLNNSFNGMTLFAPTDNAFNNLKAGTLNGLSSQEQVNLVLYHVLPRFYSTVQEKLCKGCIIGKHGRGSFPSRKSWRASGLLELVHSDLCGLMQTSSVGGNRFYSLTTFQTASNPLTTQASGPTGVYTVNVSSIANQVNVTTGVVETQVNNALYSDFPLAVYSVDKVLLPSALFGAKPPAEAPTVKAPAPEKPTKRGSAAAAVEAPSKAETEPSATAKLMTRSAGWRVAMIVGVMGIGCLL